MADLKCQFCGRDCGNAGAKTQHEAACPQNPANAQQEPARRAGGADPPQPGQQETAPAMPSGQGAGELFGSIVRVVDPDLPPEERARGARGVLGFLGDGFQWYQSYRQRKMEEQEMRAQQVELGEPENLPFPKCKNCGYQFDEDDIGLSDNKVRCPECTTLYPIIERSPDEVRAESAE